MRKSRQLKNSSKLESFNDCSINKKDQERIEGGFLFRLVNDVRCNIDRSFSLLTGGNGDGDW